MQQTDREWLIRALCWTHARCSAEAVTYFTPSLSDNHTQASTKGQEGSPSPVCSTCIPQDQTQCGCTLNLPVSTSNICTSTPTWLKGLQTLGLPPLVVLYSVVKWSVNEVNIHSSIGYTHGVTKHIILKNMIICSMPCSLFGQKMWSEAEDNKTRWDRLSTKKVIN